MSNLDYIFTDQEMTDCLMHKDFKGLHELKKNQIARIISGYKREMCTDEELRRERDV